MSFPFIVPLLFFVVSYSQTKGSGYLFSCRPLFGFGELYRHTDLMCSMSVHYIIQKTLITSKCTKRFFINCNTLLHVSTLLGHLQGELSVVFTLRLHFIVELLTVYCVAFGGANSLESCNWWKNSLCICWWLMFFASYWCYNKRAEAHRVKQHKHKHHQNTIATSDTILKKTYESTTRRAISLSFISS
jgi:hypothetical protein